MGWVTDKGGKVKKYAKGGKIDINPESNVIPQVKAAWKDFEERNPVVAKELKNFGKGVKKGAELM